MKKRIKKFDRYKIQLSRLEEAQILKYLAGDIASREGGKNIGVSHQQFINFAVQVCRQWFQERKLKVHIKK
jgi:hypothetical protein